MGWETVGEEIVTLEVGESIEGTYVGKRSELGDRDLPNPIHVFQSEGGDEIGTWASWDLDTKLDGLDGQYVRVTFRRSRDTGEVIEGKPKTVKEYRVQVRRA